MAVSKRSIVAKQPSSQKNNPTVYEDLEQTLLVLADKEKEIRFLKNEIVKATNTISELSKALNAKQITAASYPPQPKFVPKFFNPKTKDFEEVSKDELAQFNEDCQDILGMSLTGTEGEA